MNAPILKEQRLAQAGVAAGKLLFSLASKAKWPMFAYLGYLATLTLFQQRLVFNPTAATGAQRAAADTHELASVALPLADGGCLRGWLLRPRRHQAPFPAIVYYGGRTEEVSWLKAAASWFPSHAVLALNYRGYGESDGTPSEKSLLQDGLAQFDWLRLQSGVDLHNIVLIGRSLGSGVACYVAAHRSAARVVLITPYDSLLALARRRFRFAPMSIILRHRFDSVGYAKKANQPVLALLAEEDDIVPADHSYRLLLAWKGEATLTQIPGTDHLNIPEQPQTLATIAKWLGYQAQPRAVQSNIREAKIGQPAGI